MENSTMYFVCMWLELIRIFTLDLSFESRVAVWSVKSVDFAATLAYGSGFFFFFFFIALFELYHGNGVCGGVLIRGLKEYTSSGLATGAQFFFLYVFPIK